MARRFSVILIPEGNSKVRRMRIRSAVIKSALCCCFIVTGLFAFFAYSFFNLTVDRNELQRLRVATSQQRQTLQRLVVDLNEVHLQMNSLAETEARVRQLANLDADPQGIPVAIGGISESGSAKTVDDVQRQINKLQVEISSSCFFARGHISIY